MALVAEPHLGHCDLEREEPAVLAPPHDLATEAGRPRLVAGPVVFEGAIPLAVVELGDQSAEILADEFRGSVAEHPAGRRINRFQGATVGLDGDDAIRYGVEDGLDQRGAVPPRPLGGMFRGYVAEDQHGADHLSVAVTDRGAAVGDGTFAAFPGDQNGVVGQPLHRAVVQCFLNRDRGGQAGFLVDDVKHFVHRAPRGQRHGPTGQLFGNGIEQRHPALGVGRDHPVSDGAEGDGEFFLTHLEGDIGLDVTSLF